MHRAGVLRTRIGGRSRRLRLMLVLGMSVCALIHYLTPSNAVIPIPS